MQRVLSISRHFVASNGRYLSLILLLMIVAVAGGTSRHDSLSQVVVRVGALVAIAGWAVSGWPRHAQGSGWPFATAATAMLVVGIQLVPLPPEMWSGLPGRDWYVESARAVAIADPWRAISFVPDRSVAALFSLAVPLAVVVGFACLEPRDRVGMAGPLLAIIMASAILGLAQMSGGSDSALRWYEKSNDQSAVGFFANRNHQALFLACGLPVAACWAVVRERGDRNWIHGWMALAIAGFLILMLPTTGSRAGLILGGIGAVAALAIAGPLAWQRFRRLRRMHRRNVAYGTAAGGITFLAILILFGRNEAVTRITDLDAGEDLRGKVLPILWQMLAEYFPVGIGFGSFDAMYRRYEPFALLDYTYLNQAHNDALQLVLEGGILALAAASVYIAWWAWASFQVWRAPRSSRVIAARAGSAILLMTVAASFLDYPLRTPLMLAVFAVATCWLATGVTNSSAGQNDDRKKHRIGTM